MTEKLIAGYAAYTDANEYGTTALSDAPGSAESVSWVITAASLGFSVAATWDNGC
ncbi:MULTISPECIES: LxmA leader domain family RiPP [unclassified Kitasatospora]|uniref:LxmA leader domain family RiPP n=1 Tax=unclassified Kitasatospora TaxID=2633591 RepID=UPI001AE0369F|nr:LxmA leader domain family RiPP [Kitasatospora sp. RG8]MBP0452188.1 LxmA leader domain family RiPP [Kitasatospora sp. RG8]